jgi:hypothetical protein
VQPGEVHQLAPDLHLRVEPALLRHVADPAAQLGADRGAVPRHGAGVGLGDAEDHPHGGGLAGAVRADEAGERARWDGEAHAVHRPTGAEGLGHVPQLEHEPGR